MIELGKSVLELIVFIMVTLFTIDLYFDWRE